MFFALIGTSVHAQNLNAGFLYGSISQASTDGFVIAPANNNLTGLKLDKDGNVGIATSDTKGYRFAVNGNSLFLAIRSVL